MGAIDYWCNGFEPSYRPLWEAAIAAQRIPIKIRAGKDDFAPADAMVARMDEVGVDALILPVADEADDRDALAFERFCTRTAELERLASEWPGRFAGLWTIDPTQGMAGVRRAAEMLDHAAIAGLLLHTHSWDRRLDDRSYYAFYALAAERGVAVVAQAGTSGGLMASECGRPIGIDRAALYFGDVPFVLSHMGWPWVDEAIAMALKHSNVYLGTASQPPHRWPAQVVEFIRGPGRGKALWGTGYPTVGHCGALGRLDALGLDAQSRSALLEGTARTVFARLVPAR